MQSANCTDDVWEEQVSYFCGPEEEEDIEGTPAFSNTLSALIVFLILLTISFEFFKDMAEVWQRL